MKILWLSWRDFKNPNSGGAEKVTFEISKRLVKNSHKVTIFTSRFEGSMPKEAINGIKIIRSGNLVTCRFKAFLYYLRHKDFDIIVDEINTIPFFTPLFARSKSICLIHQLAREYWFMHSIFPINLFGYLTEPLLLKIYKNIPTITVSESTKSDLQKLGFQKIKIIREGIDNVPIIIPNRKENLILFIGRLTPVKKPQDAIEAFFQIQKHFPQYSLKIIGRGTKNYQTKLKNRIKLLKIGNKVELCGFVDEKIKKKYLAKAKLILIPSVREGWGLVALEAQSFGTIPIAYDVPGLKDSIKNGKTGILVKIDSKELASGAISILKNPQKQKQIARNGFNFARSFSWDNTYRDFKEGLAQVKF